MSNKRKAEVLVDGDDVGGGGTLSEKHTIWCRFHDFAKLPHKRGDKTLSRLLKCHGHEWQIILCPGGRETSDEKNVHVSIHLSLASEISGALRVKYCIRAGSISKHGTPVANFKFDDAWGYRNYALRANVIDPTKGYLDQEGALVVKADIQIYAKERPVWTSKTQCLQIDMLKLLESAKSADLILSVGESKFRAHSNILNFRAPTLASLAEDAPNGTDIGISGVEPNVFRQLLRYIYGDELPSSSDIERNALALLEASDRFGCTGMKLHVESEVVRSILTVDNAADWVLFADSHSCALLKEASIALFASKSKEVMESPGWEALKESADLLNELMQATFLRNSAAEDETDAKTMSVTTLRKKLEEKRLDVDGTREMLIERLENAPTAGHQ